MKRRKRGSGRKAAAGGGLSWVKKRPVPVVSVLVADPDKATRSTAVRVVHSIRGMRVIAEASTALEAVSATSRVKPRVTLLDLNMSSEFGASLVSILRRKSARSRVILLVGRAPESKILDALSHGAVGCIKKNEISRFLPEALVAVSSGEAWMSRKLIPKIMDRLAAYTARAEAHQ